MLLLLRIKTKHPNRLTQTHGTHTSTTTMNNSIQRRSTIRITPSHCHRHRIHHQLPPRTRIQQLNIPHQSIHQLLVLLSIIFRIQHHHNPTHIGTRNGQTQCGFNSRLDHATTAFEQMRGSINDKLFPGGDARLKYPAGETASAAEGEFFGIASKEGVVEYLIFGERDTFHRRERRICVIGGGGVGNGRRRAFVGILVIIHQVHAQGSTPTKTQSTIIRCRRMHPTPHGTRLRRRWLLGIKIRKYRRHPDIQMLKRYGIPFHVVGHAGQKGRGKFEVRFRRGFEGGEHRLSGEKGRDLFLDG